MSEGTKQDKDVPNGVVVRPLVVGKEVSSCSISDAFCKEKPKGDGRQEFNDRLGNEDDAPSHNQIDCQREPWPTPYRIDFIEDAAYHDQPLEGKNRPAKPAAHYPDEDGGVAAGNHHIDADVVELAQNVLRLSFSYPMISGAAQEHEEHADNEADDTERHLPADIGSEPHQPDGAQGKDGSSKVR